VVLVKDRYVQVTGLINDAPLGLLSSDGGGQYDNHGGGAPQGASCVSWPFFVSLVEPDVGHYCIRCCATTADCNAGRSSQGCEQVIPGQYN
jgi:hypothetical protein